MDNRLASLDWTLIRAFVAVAQGGSLSAAARDLHCSQPTIGRQIQSLQDALGVILFLRRPKGMVLTADGERLLPFAQQMMEAAGRFSMAATGADTQKAGTVRLTASVFVAHYVLPRILAELRQKEPLIQIELVPSDASENLLYRDADIALRMYRPSQLDIVARHLSDIEIGIFAAKSYIDRRGCPDDPKDLLAHDVIGYDRNDLIIRAMRQFGWDVSPNDFALRCDDQSAYWELVRAGCGIGFGQALVAQSDPNLVRLFDNLPIPTLSLWIAAPKAVRHTHRVAAVWDHLASSLSG
ncbi:LysR family transcriptional regulator [Pacificibacter marinus]|uniref:LysR family transcriptional regulator n=1 Tax=Pacificibacter marinus TaxID=658057 RepID=UPI001C07B6D0|nr:LysR family transcriptional regulator [Pacificibacter marinus]MBU2866097.1 LysR family transcriptional regulator [Pacificibacter marinus]